MTISATYIGTSTIQVTSSNLMNSSASTFYQLIDTVTDAITGTAAGSNGTSNVAGYIAGTVQVPVGGTATATTFSAGGLTGTQAGSGWTLFDCSLLGWTVTQVFRCLNKDGVTYKAAILRWNLNAHELTINTCEYWDTVTNFNTAGSVATLTARAPTNEAFTYFDCAQLGFKLDLTDFIIMATPRWLSIVTYINGEPCAWSGVFESAREDIMDVSTIGASLPCWGYMSSPLWLLGASTFAAKPLGTLDFTAWCMPRVKNGANGYLAAKGWAADFGVTNHPVYVAASGGTTQTSAAFFYYLGNVGGNRYQSNSWDTTKRLILPIKPIADYNQTYVSNYGTIFGLKALAPAGNYMNRIRLQADSDGNYTPSGTLRDHFLLNLHHKSFSTDEFSWWTNGQWLTALVPGNISARPIYICSTGSFYYTVTDVATSNSIVKYNALLNTSIVTSYTSPGGTIYDIKFDGERYVYFGTSTGLGIIDIRASDATAPTLIAIGGGVYTMVITPTYVYCAGAGASATPTITRVLRSTNLVDSASSNGFTSGAVAVSTYGDATTRLIDGVLDLDGNVWFAPCMSTGANFKLVKVAPSGLSYPVIGNVSAVAWNNVGLHVLDGTNIVLYQYTSTAVSIYQTQYNPRTSVATTSTTQTVTTMTVTSNVKMYVIKYDGVLFTIPRIASGSGYPLRTTLCATTGGSAITVLNGIVQLLAPVQGTALTVGSTATQNQFIWTDGARLIGNSDTGLRIFTNVHGVNTSNNSTLGQLALPA
jgi:hypothetical protein